MRNTLLDPTFPMKRLHIAAFAVSVTPAFAQNTIERIVIDAVDRHERREFVMPPGTFTDPGLYLGSTLHAAEVPPLSGVTLTSVHVQGFGRPTGELTVFNPTPIVQHTGGGPLSFNGADLVGSGWGPSFGGGSYDVTYAGRGQYLPGETVSLTLHASNASWNATYGDDPGELAPIIASPELRANAGLTSISYGAGGLEVSGWVEVDLVVTETAVVELEEVTMIPTCTSPPNTLGAPAQLSAYGSLQAGEDWLTIRAEGVPEGQFGVMFVGTAPGLTVLPTYNICIGGMAQRVGGIQVSSGTIMDFEFDLLDWASGDAAYCQVIHRDPIFGVSASVASVVIVE